MCGCVDVCVCVGGRGGGGSPYLSAFDRMTIMTFSQVIRNVPSIPQTSIALTSIRVSRNGTFSGYLARFIATSKQSPKSTCMMLPVIRSSIRFEGWRSPSPRMYLRSG